MTSAQYRNVEIDLETVVDSAQKRVVPGAEPGNTVYGVSVVPQNFTDPPLPLGAQVRLHFGAAADEVILTDNLVAFEFPCGHDGGVYFSNAVALPGERVRLLLNYSPMGVNYET